MFGRNVLWVDKNATVVEATARHGQGHADQRPLVGGRVRYDHQEKCRPQHCYSLKCKEN